MNNIVTPLKTYFSLNYLWTTATGSKYELFYLAASLLILFGVIIVRLYIFFKGGRSEVYRSFDRLWFWGFVALGLTGLFIYFSRFESIAYFSTRIVSYAWLVIMLVFTGYLFYYYRKLIPEKLHHYYDKKRKAKYLSR